MGRDTGRQRHEFIGSELPLVQAFFSPDGGHVLTVGGCSLLGLPGEARLWDAATGQPVGGPLRHDGTLVRAVFGPGGRTVLTWGKDRAVRRWDAATGQPLGVVLRFPNVADWRSTFAFSPDGRWAVIGTTDRTACRWDLTSGVRAGPRVPHAGAVVAVAFAGDASTFLTYDETTDGVGLWDAAIGSVTAPGRSWYLRLPALAYYRRDSQMMVVRHGWDANEVTVYDWTYPAERLLRREMPSLIGHPRAVLSPDGQMYLKLREGDPTVRSWSPYEVRPVAATLGAEADATLALWAQVASRMTLDDGDQLRPLGEDAWQAARRGLAERLGPGPAPGLVAAAAADPLLWVRQEAANLEVVGDWDAVLPLLDRLVEAEAGGHAYNRRGHANAMLGRFAPAAADFGAAVGPGGTGGRWRSTGAWREIGVICLAAGDRPAYRAACAATWQEHQDGKSQDWIWDAADLWALAPDGLGDYARALAAAEKAPAEHKPAEQLVLGALRYRAGQAQAALAPLATAEAVYPTATKARLFLALAHHRLGHDPEARRWLAKAEAPLNEAAPAGQSLDDRLYRLECRILRREAAARLAGPAARR